MGYDIVCRAQMGRESGEGRALLETDFVQFRSESLGFKVAFRDLTHVAAAGEFLELRFVGKRARLELGAKAAERWAAKILNPPDRMAKLGVKAGTAVCLVGELEAEFAREVDGRETGLADADLVFLAAPTVRALERVAGLAKAMRQGAGLWIVYPKGRTEIREIDVLNAGRAAGLKDVKVMRFSEAETALKFVAPKGTA